MVPSPSVSAYPVHAGNEVLAPVGCRLCNLGRSAATHRTAAAEAYADRKDVVEVAIEVVVCIAGPYVGAAAVDIDRVGVGLQAVIRTGVIAHGSVQEVRLWADERTIGDQLDLDGILRATGRRDVIRGSGVAGETDRGAVGCIGVRE